MSTYGRAAVWPSRFSTTRATIATRTLAEPTLMLGISEEASPTDTTQPPVAVPRRAEATAGQTATLDIVGGAFDPDTASLTLVSHTGASNGTAAVSGNQATYRPNAGYSGNDTTTFVISDGQRTSTSRIRWTVGATSGAAWFQAGWVRNSSGVLVAPYSRREFNCGIFRFSDAGATQFRNLMGYDAEIIAGNVGRAPGSSTWEEVYGGNYSAGDRSWSAAQYVQPSLDSNNAASFNTAITGSNKNRFLVITGSIFPRSLTYQNFVDLGNASDTNNSLPVDGQNVCDIYRRMGARMRHRFVTQLGWGAGRLLTRFNRESTNSDTGWSFASGGQLYTAGRAAGYTDAQITRHYNKAMKVALRYFNEGYGTGVKHAFSPAQKQGGGPAYPYLDYVTNDAAGIYDVFCFSFHPSPDKGIDTDAKARQLVRGPRSGYNTPADARAAAIARSAAEGRTIFISSYENSANYENPSRVERGDDISRYDLVYQELFDFYDEVTGNNPGACVGHCIFADPSVSKTYMSSRPSVYDAAQGTAWSDYVTTLENNMQALA